MNSGDLRSLEDTLKTFMNAQTEQNNIFGKMSENHDVHLENLLS
jgi:hypothetical protein